MSEKRRRRRLNKRIINGWMKNDRITRTGIYRSNKHFRIYSVNLISCRFFPRSCFPFRLLFFQWNVTRRAICWKPTAWKTHGNSGHKGFYDNYGKKNGNGNNEGLGLNQREMSRFVARWMANLLFSPRLFNKNWKNHVLYLIAADLINVAITFAARIPFFLSRTFRTLAEVILWAHIFSYFYIALTIRFGGRFDATNPNRDFLRGIRVCAPSKRPCFHLEKVYGKLASRDIRTRLVSPILEIRNCASIDKFVRASYARYIFSFSINVSPAFSPA